MQSPGTPDGRTGGHRACKWPRPGETSPDSGSNGASRLEESTPHLAACRSGSGPPLKVVLHFLEDLSNPAPAQGRPHNLHPEDLRMLVLPVPVPPLFPFFPVQMSRTAVAEDQWASSPPWHCMSLGTFGNGGVPCLRPLGLVGSKAVSTTLQPAFPSLGFVLASAFVVGRIPLSVEGAMMAVV